MSNDLDFYRKVLGREWFNRENLTKLLQHIGETSLTIKHSDVDKDGLYITKDGIEATVEEYDGCGQYSTRKAFVWWEDIVDHFFSRLENSVEKKLEN